MSNDAKRCCGMGRLVEQPDLRCAGRRLVGRPADSPDMGELSFALDDFPPVPPTPESPTHVLGVALVEQMRGIDSELTVGGRTVTKTSKDRRVVVAWWREMVAQSYQGRFLPGNTQTVADYLRTWLESIEGSVRPKTADSYALNVRRLSPHIGHLPLRKLRPADVQTCHAALLKDGNKGQKGLSARSVEQAHAVLHRALKQAVLWGSIPQNPCDAVNAPRPERKEMKTLTAEQAHCLIDGTKDDRLGAPWVLLVTTGLRSGEAGGLKWEDIDFTTGKITVQRSLQRQKGKGLVFVDVKTHRSRRSVHLNSGTIATLRRHQARCLAAGTLSIEGLVFTNQNGNRLDSGNVRESLGRRLKNLGLPAVRTHDLRHTAATLHMNMGTNPKVVQEILGHSTVNITLQTYSHVMEDLHVDAARKMDAIFRDLPASTESLQFSCQEETSKGEGQGVSAS